jgi:hypothetical protein
MLEGKGEERGMLEERRGVNEMLYEEGCKRREKEGSYWRR